ALALVLADRATRRWMLARGVLDAAPPTDERLHRHASYPRCSASRCLAPSRGLKSTSPILQSLRDDGDGRPGSIIQPAHLRRADGIVPPPSRSDGPMVDVDFSPR